MIPGILAGAMGQSGGGGDPYWGNVVSLLHFDGADGSTSFPDERGAIWTPSGNAQLDTASPKFGIACALFDGSGDSLASSAEADFNLFAGAATIEFFARWVGSTANQSICQIQSSSSNRVTIGLLSGDLYVYGERAGSGAIRISTAAPAAGTWHHVALVGTSSSAWVLYVNGMAQGAYGSDLVNPSTNWTIYFGRAGSSGTNYYNGMVDEFRATAGVARYTSTFTPPAAPFPNS